MKKILICLISLLHFNYATAQTISPIISGGGGGSGTVTSVSVATQNGVSAVVTSPTTTPSLAFTLGAITPTTVNGLTITANGTNTLAIAAGKTLTASNTLTFTGTDASSIAFGTGGTVLYANQTLTLSGDVSGSGTTAITTAIGATKVTSTMLNSDVFSTAHSWAGQQTFVAPILGTPASGVGTNLTGTASGLTAGNVTTNANLTGPVTSVGNATTISANAVTLAMLATQATNTVLGNATSGTAVPTALSVGSCSSASSALIWTTNTGFGCNTSITANSIAVGGITGLGTGVATALALNVGSAGAPVTFNGAGGTPSSMTATNLSGTAASLTAGNVTTNANLTGPITSVGNATTIAASPALTGTPTTPTATAATNTTQIASTAFAEAHNRPNFRVYSASSQTPTVGAWTLVNNDTVVIDTGSYFNTSTHLYTPLVAGTYQFCGTLDMSSTLAGVSTYFIGLAKNGSRIAIAGYTGGVGTDEFGATVCDQVAMNGSTDTMQVQGNIGAGTSPTFGGNITQTYFHGFRIGP